MAAPNITQKLTQNIALNKPTEMVKKKAQEVVRPKEELLKKDLGQSSMMKSFKEAKKGYQIDRKA